MTKPYFGRLLTAMVTPFAEDGSVNYEAGCKLADWLLANGTDGLVIEGSTGEAATMDMDEKIKKEVSKCVCLCANCHREFHYFYGVVPNDPINQLAEYLDITTDFIDDIAVNTIQN